MSLTRMADVTDDKIDTPNALWGGRPHELRMFGAGRASADMRARRRAEETAESSCSVLPFDAHDAVGFQAHGPARTSQNAASQNRSLLPIPPLI